MVHLAAAHWTTSELRLTPATGGPAHGPTWSGPTYLGSPTLRLSRELRPLNIPQISSLCEETESFSQYTKIKCIPIYIACIQLLPISTTYWTGSWTAQHQRKFDASAQHWGMRYTSWDSLPLPHRRQWACSHTKYITTQPAFGKVSIKSYL